MAETHQAAPATGARERARTCTDRRTFTWRTLAMGIVRPRRRSARRDVDRHRNFVDWHDPWLLALTVGVLMLSIADALFTLTVLEPGAREVNPFMDALIQSDVRAFAVWKMLLTGVGVVILVALSRLRVFRVIRVRHLLQAVFIGYCVLTWYHVTLLDRLL